LCVGDVPVHRHVEAIDELAHADQTAPEGKTHRDATRAIGQILVDGRASAGHVRSGRIDLSFRRGDAGVGRLMQHPGHPVDGLRCGQMKWGGRGSNRDQRIMGP
jgi:hypothetical protein